MSKSSAAIGKCGRLFWRHDLINWAIVHDLPIPGDPVSRTEAVLLDSQIFAISSERLTLNIATLGIGSLKERIGELLSPSYVIRIGDAASCIRTRFRSDFRDPRGHTHFI